MNKLYVIGTGSQARYVIENCKNNDSYKVEGLIDIETKDNVGKIINGVKVIGFIDEMDSFDGSVIVAYGKNEKKKEIVSKLSDFATVISKDAYISDHVEIGVGCIINPGVVIMPNVKIGDHVIIHSGCVIEHDNIIGDYVNIAPGVKTAGNVTIGSGSYVYTGASIVPKVKIGKDVVVGAGAVVTKDVEDGLTVIGIPAKPVEK